MTANTEIYTYVHTRSLHDARPIWTSSRGVGRLTRETVSTWPGAVAGTPRSTSSTRVVRDSTPVPAISNDRSSSASSPVMDGASRSEEHTSELQSLMRISYAVFCLKKNTKHTTYIPYHATTS